MGLLSIKKGNAKGSNDGKSLKGTWIHRDFFTKEELDRIDKIENLDSETTINI